MGYTGVSVCGSIMNLYFMCGIRVDGAATTRTHGHAFPARTLQKSA